MEDLFLIVVVCLLLFLIGALPLGLLIWVYSLSKKVKRLQRTVDEWQKGAAGVPGLGAPALTDLGEKMAPLPSCGAALPARSAEVRRSGALEANVAFVVAPSVPVTSGVSATSPDAADVEVASAASPGASSDLSATSGVSATSPDAADVEVASAASLGASSDLSATSGGPVSSPDVAGVEVASVASSGASPDIPEFSAGSADSVDSDMTGFMLGNLFNKLGALVVIVAVGIFVKLIAPYVFFNAWVKLIVGYFAGCACLGAGLALRTREKYRNYAEVVVGLGLAVNFIITYCSCTVFELWSAHIALLIATAWLVVVYSLAAYMRRPSMLVLGLVAGYANLTLGEDISATFLGAYILLLNVMTLVAVYRSRRWLPVTTGNLAISLIVLWGMSTWEEASVALAIFDCLGLWLLYVCFDMLRYSRGISNPGDNVCSYLNFFALSCFTGGCAYQFSYNINAVGESLLIIALAYALLARIYRQLAPEVSSSQVNMSLLALLVALETFELGVGRSVLLVLVAWALAARALGKERLHLANWAMAYLVAALWPLLDSELAKYPLCRWGECSSFLQLYLVQWGWPALGCAGAAVVFRSRAHDEKYGTYYLVFRLLAWTLVYVAASFEINGFLDQPRGRWSTNLLSPLYTYATLLSIYAMHWHLVASRLRKTWVSGLAYLAYVVAALVLASGLLANLITDGRGFWPFISLRCLSVVLFGVTSVVLYRGTQQRVFLYLMAGLVFLGLHLEALALAECTASYVVTGAWLVYAATLVLVGLFRPQRDCTWVGIAAALATVCRLFVVDAADLAGIYKLLLFLAVGGALMGLSFFYTKLAAVAKK